MTASQLFRLSPSALRSIADSALGQKHYLVVAWVFEAMVIRMNDYEAASQLIWEVILGYRHVDLAQRVVEVLLKGMEDPERFVQSLHNDNWVCYVVGKVLHDTAKRYRGVNKPKLQTAKKSALVYLGRARKQLAQHGDTSAGTLVLPTPAVVDKSAEADGKRRAYVCESCGRKFPLERDKCVWCGGVVVSLGTAGVVTSGLEALVTQEYAECMYLMYKGRKPARSE